MGVNLVLVDRYPRPVSVNRVPVDVNSLRGPEKDPETKTGNCRSIPCSWRLLRSRWFTQSYRSPMLPGAPVVGLDDVTPVFPERSWDTGKRERDVMYPEVGEEELEDGWMTRWGIINEGYRGEKEKFSEVVGHRRLTDTR